MNINNKTNQSLELKIANWELDFYSRPIIESNGKKRWELIICSTSSYKNEDIFLWNKKCPANEVNSLWLTTSLNEAINDAKKEGWGKPSIVRFWRSSMKSIIKKSLEALSIEAIVSRRTYDLLDRIKFLEKGRIGLNTALLENSAGELIIDKQKVMQEATERALKTKALFDKKEEDK